MSKRTGAAQKENRPRRYVAELNNPKCYGSPLTNRLSRQEGIDFVEKLPHKTTFIIEASSFKHIRNALRKCTRPRIGGVIVFSQTTGNTFIMNNRGNRRGLFQKI